MGLSQSARVYGMIPGKEALQPLYIFNGFSSSCKITDPIDLVFKGARCGVLRVENLLTFIIILAFDDKGGRSSKLGLQGQGIIEGRL
jgi:hypothetical protein